MNNDGSPATITVNMPNFHGLIDNSGAYSGITVMNLFVHSAGGSTSLASSSGWIGRAHFVNGTIVNCSSDGSISMNSGGIVGYGARDLTISGCYSSGSIGIGAGGIAGEHADDLNISLSASTGPIGTSAGGLVGIDAINTAVQYSFSIGNIEAAGGGIYGAGAENSSALLCYSSGNIAEDAGGIYGGDTAISSASNSYSLGTIGAGAGSFYGSDELDSSADNCYSLYGSSENFFGLDPSGASATNCISENGSGWNDGDAVSVLTAGGADNAWYSSASNTPFNFSVFGISPYTQTSYDGDGNLTNSFSQTVEPGVSTVPALISGNSYTIISVNGGPAYSNFTIDSTTGVISASPSVPSGTYDILVGSSFNDVYSTSTFNLTINSQ